MTSHFDRDTALSPAAAEGLLVGRISEDWWVQSGPNGGYLAAIALRGAATRVGEPDRAPRSLFARFLAAPEAGPFELQADVVKAGRSMTTVAVSMQQQGRTFLTASACFSEAFSPIAFRDSEPPVVRPMDEAEPIPKRIPLNQRYDMWRAIGGEFRKSDRALSGGYIRFADPRPVDALALAALWDAWPPSVFARRIEQRFRGAAPTVEVSVYFRKRLPLPTDDPERHVILRVEANAADEGFVVEDGEVWTRDGELLAQSRQLQLLI
ncbi:MAG: thioesterase family protein [Myxococcales bacterium]|jgi:acyl-CoA thioesterase